MKKLLIAVGVCIVGLVVCYVTLPRNSTKQFVYPKVISVAQTLAMPESDWESFENDVPSQLTAIALFEGHPKEKASLVPDQETEVNERRVVSTWHLTDNGKRHYWIACYYDQTRIALTRPIDPKVSSCEVTRDPLITIAGQAAILEITFK